MTEDSKVMEFGSHTGQVIKFFNRKGFGFIHDLNDERDYFVHNTDIRCKEGLYRKLYPGEYVSYNLGKQGDGRDKCIDVRGIMGHLLLTENPDNNYRVYLKEDHRTYDNHTYGGDSVIDDPDSSDEGDEGVSDKENSDDPVSETKEEKEIINKDAPEGIEVAEFDGLNINEEMG